ncbi:hypothetical protein [Streptomyces cacaoi]
MTSERRSHAGELDEIERALEQALDVVRNVPREGLGAVEWLEAAARIGVLQAEAREASGKVRHSVLGSAQTALLTYLRMHVGEPVPSAALEGVAGIQAWTRRIRELRDPFGWTVESGNRENGMRKDQYRLGADRLDRSATESDRIAEAVSGGTPKERLLEYLIHLSPWSVSPKQLEKAAGVTTWRRAIEELVDEGWMIRTHEDEPDVPPGFYRLATLED